MNLFIEKIPITNYKSIMGGESRQLDRGEHNYRNIYYNL